jgi:hypothetical protein
LRTTKIISYNNAPAVLFNENKGALKKPFGTRTKSSSTLVTSLFYNSGGKNYTRKIIYDSKKNGKLSPLFNSFFELKPNVFYGELTRQYGKYQMGTIEIKK